MTVYSNIFKCRNDWNVITFRCKKPACHTRVAMVISDIWGVNPLSNKTYQGTKEVISRQLFAVMMRKYSKDTLKVIGGYISKDHATILTSKKSIQDLLDTDKVFKERYKSIDQLCKLL